MAEISEIVGALMASIANARRQSDEQSIAIARYYQTDPLLRTLSVPRLRIPELTLEVPLLIERFEPATAETRRSIAEITGALTAVLNENLTRYKVRLTSWVKAFQTELTARLTPLAATLTAAQLVEVTKNVLDVSGVSVAEKHPDAYPAIVDAVLAAAARTEPVIPGRPATTVVNPQTAAVKELGSPDTVVRLKMVVKEEGLEWTVTPNADGKPEPRLVPE